MERQIRVGVIGLGEVAQVIHLPILEALSDRYQVTAVCDVSPTLLATIGDRYRIPAHARHVEFRDLVARDDVEAVFVLNSDEYHADCVVAACDAGKHVLVEKPMCLHRADVDRIVAARDRAGVQVMVAYMRRFAPAFLTAVEDVAKLERIDYVRVRDIIGRNRLIIDQAHAVIRPTDIPAELTADRAERAKSMVQQAIGEAPPELIRSYRLLCGLSSHDLSAMRELIGFPQGVLSATNWRGGSYLHIVFDYGDYRAVLETGVDEQLRFDAHIEVYGPSRSLRIQYDTPYIRHLPTTLTIVETDGDAFTERTIRPTYADPYTREIEAFHDVVVNGNAPKTTPEDFGDDLRLFEMIVERLREAGS